MFQSRDESILLDQNSFKHLVNSKTYHENNGRLNSIQFSTDGDLLIASSDDDTIAVYNMVSGTRNKSINSKKYGVGLISFSKDTTKAIHSSTKIDHTIRFLELTGNKYLRYFQGHSDVVTSLSMSPMDEMFISVSKDKTIRLWDTRSNNCQGLMQLTSNAVAAFDPEGLIFAAGMGNDTIKLYDLRSFDKGPFSSFPSPPSQRDNGCTWTGMKFSYCGKYIMINTDGAAIKLIDAFTGEVKQILQGHENIRNIPLEGSFSPCSNFVACGSSNKQICIWSTETGELVYRLQTTHESTPHIAQFSPRYYAMASGCNKLNLWCASEELKRNP